MNDLVTIGSSVSLIAKSGILIFLIIYIIFSYAVGKQVNTMTDTLEVGFETQIKVIAMIHLVLSIVVFLTAIVIL